MQCGRTGTVGSANEKDLLDGWVERARAWAGGSLPADLPPIDAGPTAPSRPREVFVYFIHEGKVRAPAAAMAMLERLAQAPRVTTAAKRAARATAISV